MRPWYYFCHRWRKLKLLKVRLLTAFLFLDHGLNIWKSLNCLIPFSCPLQKASRHPEGWVALLPNIENWPLRMNSLKNCLIVLQFMLSLLKENMLGLRNFPTPLFPKSPDFLVMQDTSNVVAQNKVNGLLQRAYLGYPSPFSIVTVRERYQ